MGIGRFPTWMKDMWREVIWSLPEKNGFSECCSTQNALSLPEKISFSYFRSCKKDGICLFSIVRRIRQYTYKSRGCKCLISLDISFL